MTRFLYPIVLLVVAVTNIRANVIPPVTTGSPPLSDAEQLLFGVYHNFTIGIAKSIADNDVAMSAQPAPVPENPCVEPAGIQVNSAFGLTHLLAIIHEQIWQVSVPVFEKLLLETPKTLSDAYEFILKNFLQDPDVTFSSAIFTADSPTVTPGLGKLKTQVINTDLTKPESVDSINNFLVKFLSTPSFTGNYIPKGATISPAAKAILVNTLHATETWSSPPTKVQSPEKFNGVDDVDMIEIQGTFQVMESDKAVEVFIPFQNTKRGLSLILPSDIMAAFKGDLGDPQLVNYTLVRVQIPVFKATIRNLEANLTTLCNFKKEENFAQLLDHVLVIALTQEKFEAISLTGGQINNVEKFKKLTVTGKTQQGECGTEGKFLTAPLPQGNSNSTRLIVFNRPFTWTLLDQNLGPIFAGTVESAQSQATSNSSTMSEPFVFGLENQLSFAKCF